MAAILLAWNPDKYQGGSLQDELVAVHLEGRATQRWSVGNRKEVAAGTRFFMIRLGSDPRGLVGSGWTAPASALANDEHWNVDRAAKGEKARYADIYFDVLEEVPIIPMRELKEGPLSAMHWSTQISGISIPESITAHLEELWASRTQGAGLLDQDSSFGDQRIAKAHGYRATVNKYERCPKARALCLGRYGMKCFACETLLSDVYGEAAAKVIHVHHLELVSSLPNGHEIDPIKDLRPVCPNCHSVIHSRQPHYSIEELQEMMAAEKRPPRKKL
jgi:5-methylcytosine-specific restriction protein A